MRLVLRDPHDPGRQLTNSVAAMIDRSATALADGLSDRRPVPSAVHESRRVLKRARALLRLVNGHKNKRTKNMRTKAQRRGRALSRDLRDVRRQLTGLRDRDARFEAVDRLLADEDSPVDALLDLRRRLAASPRPNSPGRTMAAAAADLRAAQDRAIELRIRDRGFETFARGLRSVYKRGRKAVHRLDDSNSDARAFHRLRKRAKDLRHALEFLEVLWPAVLTAWHTELHRLTDLLGEANDYSLVLADLGPHAPDEVTSILRRARQRRWRDARPLAQRIWSCRSQEFIYFVDALWQAWADEIDARPEHLHGPARERSSAGT